MDLTLIGLHRNCSAEEGILPFFDLQSLKGNQITFHGNQDSFDSEGKGMSLLLIIPGQQRDKAWPVQDVWSPCPQGSILTDTN